MSEILQGEISDVLSEGTYGHETQVLVGYDELYDLNAAANPEEETEEDSRLKALRRTDGFNLFYAGIVATFVFLILLMIDAISHYFTHQPIDWHGLWLSWFFFGVGFYCALPSEK